LNSGAINQDRPYCHMFESWIPRFVRARSCHLLFWIHIIAFALTVVWQAPRFAIPSNHNEMKFREV